MYATDTMDGWVKSLDRKWYAQVLSNGTYLAEIYSMDKKADTGQALKTLVMEIGVPEELTVDWSKEKYSPGNELMNSHFCHLYYFLSLLFSLYPLYFLAQNKKHDPHGDG